ncbi:hypothetical protein SKAU_G00040950 [Synaphobranchus kaupii]|uniref:Uncharacterized protein n=1 Tax=Synaphobranchus kaupii TaxID=118154 RepID=A0A9Q1J8S7_SYNKA|nr:hypothetical protein SKAU_G00040950 [Synaphobranchus kaupii]
MEAPPAGHHAALHRLPISLDLAALADAGPTRQGFLNHTCMLIVTHSPAPVHPANASHPHSEKYSSQNSPYRALFLPAYPSLPVPFCDHGGENSMSAYVDPISMQHTSSSGQ